MQIKEIQIDGFGVGVAGNTLADDGNKAIDTAATVLLREAGNLGLDGLIGLGSHEPCRAPVDKRQQQKNRGGEHHHVQQG